MQGFKYRWRFGPSLSASDTAAYAAAPHHLAPTVAQVLYARGVRPAALTSYLTPQASQIGDPFLLHGMEAAVRRIRAAMRRRERITVYGDFDVDGVGATVLLVEALGELGADVDYVIPGRDEGHGLHIHLLDQLASRGTRLVIAVDTGVTAVRAVAQAKARGLDVIVVDHHEPDAVLPEAMALINPSQPECSYGYTGLCGTGLAYKLLTALVDGRSDARAFRRRALDLVGLATVADVAPLDGENRVLTRAAIMALQSTPRPGLRALYDRAGVVARTLTAESIAFTLAPRLNAAGRLAHANLAARLLLTADVSEAVTLASDLERLNGERKDLVGRAYAAAVPMVDLGQRVHLVVTEDWPGGILGLVAARIVEETGGVAIVLGRGHDGMCRGSARAPDGFHLHDALTRCAGLLDVFGGHARAAGLSIAEHSVPALRAQLVDMARDTLPEPGPLTLSIDACLEAASLTHEAMTDLYEGLTALEPCGSGNAVPVLAWRGVRIVSCRHVGAERTHAKLTIESGSGIIDAIAFRRGQDVGNVRPGQRVHIAARLTRNTFGGRTQVELHLCDVALCR